jgi:hypothetical protein
MREKRRTGRSTEAFHDLAEKIDDTAREVFSLASREERMGATDSPDPEEWKKREPGDWAEADHD